MKRWIILFVFVFFMYLPFANAIILQPPSINYDFVAGAHYDFSFKVQGSKNEDPQDVLIYVIGDLNQSIILNATSANIKPGIWTEFSGVIDIPQELTPGTHTNRITIVQASSSGGAVGSVAGVELLIGVKVPYPGKYAEISFVADNIKLDSIQNFQVNMINLGREDINLAYSDIDIFNNVGNLVGSVKTNFVSITSGNSVTLKALWDSKGNPRGQYLAKARIFYDELSKEDQKNFNIGDLYMEISNINASRIKKGDIGKVGVNVQSFWNDVIKDVYMQIEFKDKQGQQFSFRSGNLNFEPFSIKNLIVYVDTANINPGSYDAKYTLFYSNKTAQKEDTIFITSGFIVNITLTQILLILVIIILLLLVFVNFIKFKKQNKESVK